MTPLHNQLLTFIQREAHLFRVLWDLAPDNFEIPTDEEIAAAFAKYPEHKEDLLALALARG